MAGMGKRKGKYRVLVGTPEGKKPFGKARCRWENYIKMDLQEVEWGTSIGFIWLTIGTSGGVF